ncbi:MAG: multicopper oxidase domain-containing protein [Azospirillum sp.]|nr:multicopper oxidase domain-containing protein [Azospirillum sp.]
MKRGNDLSGTDQLQPGNPGQPGAAGPNTENRYAIEHGTGHPSLSRRELLTRSTGLAVAAAATTGGLGATAALAHGDMAGQGVTVQVAQFADTSQWFQEFLEPPVIFSDRMGRLIQTLRVQFADIKITTLGTDGMPTVRHQCVRTYNGRVPGTTFRVRAGDRLEFEVINQLPPNQEAPKPGQDASCMQLMDANFPGCFNTTNLHTHGLHVSPSTTDGGISSDDVHVVIPPVGDTLDHSGSPSSRKYCLYLPSFHGPGTHWYHAHVHGSSALQVSNGIAGALIVEEPDDQKIPVDQELIWMVQEVVGGATAPSTCSSDPKSRDVYLSGSAVYSNLAASETDDTQPYGRGSPSGNVGFTVNSLSIPTLRMQPNEVQRWRVIDGTSTPRGFFNFLLTDENKNPVPDAMYLIAVDGITFYGHSPQPVGSTGWSMSPGNRADVLVSVTQPGKYLVWRKDNDFTGGYRNPGDGDQVLAVVEVDGPALPKRDLATIPLPGWDKAPRYLQPIWDYEVNAAALSYDFEAVKRSGKPGYFGGFKINGKAYGNAGGSHPNTDVNLGEVRKIALTNGAQGNHPFHVHVNPFQVEGDKIDPNGPDDPGNWRWWDTIVVPENQPAVNIRSRFLNYPGKFVLHCHILVHEDAGMMQDFTVLDPGKVGTGPCLPLDKCQEPRPARKAG